MPILDPAALHGLPSEIAHAIGPHTEADPIAILVQFLTAAGNAIGRGLHYRVEGDRHGTNMFAVLVWETSKGRKGTSCSRIREIMAIADPQWTDQRVHTGLSSGEGVIWAVRDPITGFEKEGKSADSRRVEVQIDPGVADKRLMVMESEFGGTLTVMRREGNILSRVLRDGWDRGKLATLTKNSPAHATGARLSTVGHITADELRASLDRISIANGYANRFLWVLVRRSRVLPFGGALDQSAIVKLGGCTRAVIGTARRVDRVEMTAEAREGCQRAYPELSEGRPGLLGALTARAEAQTIRLALLYALLNGQSEIGMDHLMAGVAVWEYADASVRYIWGDALATRSPTKSCGDCEALAHSARRAPRFVICSVGIARPTRSGEP
jgi:hypothetical protein